MRVIILSSFLLLLTLTPFISAQTFGSRCAAREINWADDTDAWTANPADWIPSHIPEKWNFVRLHTDTSAAPTYNVTLTQNVSVSRVDIGANARLDILPQVKLLLVDYELHCWETKWCSNHGVCIGLNQCQCDAGWSGADCDIPTGVCPNPSQTRDACGICGGDGSFCSCNDYIESPVEEVARLLLLYTNEQIIESIEETLSLLEVVKLVSSYYDPNTQTLTPEIRLWLLYFQQFCSNCLDTFYRQNWEFLQTLNSTPGIVDACS